MTRPKSSERDRRKTGAVSRQLILDTAAQLFSEKGYTATGVREIAENVGVQPASIYYHFASKERIVEEILCQGLLLVKEAIADALAALPDTATPKQRFEAVLAGHLRGLHANITYTSVNTRFSGQLPETIRDRIEPIRAEVNQVWRQTLTEARDTGWLNDDVDVSLTPALILGAINRTVAWYRPEPGTHDRLIAACNALFSGIWRPQNVG